MMKKILLAMMVFCLMAFASSVPAQTVVGTTTANVHSSASAVPGLPAACYQNPGSFPNQPLGCQENEIANNYFVFGSAPLPFWLKTGYAPLNEGQIVVSAYDPLNTSTNFCGTYWDTCYGPNNAPTVPNGKQFLHEIACGSSLFNQFPGVFTPTVANNVFLAQVDCSQVDVGNGSTPGTCLNGGCKSVMPDIELFEVIPGANDTNGSANFIISLRNKGATPSTATSTQVLVVDDATNAAFNQYYPTNAINPVNYQIGSGNIVSFSSYFNQLPVGVYTATVYADTYSQSLDANPFNNTLQAHFAINPVSNAPSINWVQPYTNYVGYANTLSMYGKNQQAMTGAVIDNGAMTLPISMVANGTHSWITFTPAIIGALGLGPHTIYLSGPTGNSNTMVFFISQ